MFAIRKAPKAGAVLAVPMSALLILFSLAGCGSSSGDETTAELTHAQVVKRGDAICARTSTTASKELTTQIKKLPEGLTPEAEKELILTVSLPAMETMAADLSDIDAPAKEKQELRAISTAFRDSLARVKANTRLIVQDPYAKASGLADDFGFVECSKF